MNYNNDLNSIAGLIKWNMFHKNIDDFQTSSSKLFSSSSGVFKYTTGFLNLSINIKSQNDTMFIKEKHEKIYDNIMKLKGDKFK